MKSMLLSNYFEIRYPQYIYMRLKPMTSIRNYNSDKIARAIASLYKQVFECIRKENKKFFFDVPIKVGYYIYIEKNRVEFYFIVPEMHKNLLKAKIGDTWKGITVDIVGEIPRFDDNALRYYVTYKKEDALSLATDKRTNALLASLLSVIDIMEMDDRIGIFYNFIPVSQSGWRAKHENTMKKYYECKPIDKVQKGALFLIQWAILLVISCFQTIVDIYCAFTGEKAKTIDMSISPADELSKETMRKKDSLIVGAQIMLLSASTNKIRATENIRAVGDSFKTINADNELVFNPCFNNKQKFTDRDLKVPKMLMSPLEIQNLIALPGRELLEEYNSIEHIKTVETEVPFKLRNGVMCIGTNTFKGNTQRAYLPTDKHLQYLTLTIIGPTRAGKSTLIANLSKDAIEHSETVILFDYCGNCELSNEVAAVIPKDKVLVIDCSNFETLQGMGYNEVTPANDEIMEVYRCAKTKTSQLMTLINAVAGEELKDRMERYLEAACVVVFIQNGAVKDVFSVLQNHKVRQKYIENYPKNQKSNLVEYIYTLQELDERDKNGEVRGTKLYNIQGILNRVHKLKQNAYMELMLKRDCKKNINLIREMQKAQLICIKMPEVMFSTEVEKDAYATYWLTKIWGALQKRKWDYSDNRRVKVNIVFDELYQVPNCQSYLRSKLSQLAKFSCKPIISCHYLGQINLIRDELKAANTSYMLLSGCDKDNYKELKDELYPYEVEDLLNLKRYESLNLIVYEEGKAKFITKMPPPIKR